MIRCKSTAPNAVTDDVILAREKKWRKTLPDAFKAFLKANNGGIPETPIQIEGKWTLERFLCLVPKLSESEYGAYDIGAVITENDAFMVFDGDTLGYDLIPFARLNHDSLLCLCYETETPSVAVWQLEGSQEFKPNYHKCYESFSAFLKACGAE